jgi:hypothetical protein
MQSDIHKKTSDYSEDRLTGDFFGSLRYIPFDIAMKPILLDGIYPSLVNEQLRKIELREWADNIRFWPKFKEGEPDILIELDTSVVVIEVKLLSLLSSDDDFDNSALQSEEMFQNSANQLSKYARLLSRIAGQRSKHLIFLAPQDFAHVIWNDVKKRRLIKGDISFSYLTWQNAYEILKKVKAKGFNKIIVDDLLELLKIKGFEGFRQFIIEEEGVCDRYSWKFHERFRSFIVKGRVNGNCCWSY